MLEFVRTLAFVVRVSRSSAASSACHLQTRSVPPSLPPSLPSPFLSLSPCTHGAEVDHLRAVHGVRRHAPVPCRRHVVLLETAIEQVRGRYNAVGIRRGHLQRSILVVRGPCPGLASESAMAPGSAHGTGTATGLSLICALREAGKTKKKRALRQMSLICKLREAGKCKKQAASPVSSK